MHDLEDVSRLPDDFDGRVRLFPLPELVLFPHAVQPLHIFEPRYCEMLHESLASDQLIAMTTLTGGVPIADEEPPIASTVCISKIISHVELEDGKHNILLVGVRRARILRELDVSRSFRIAEVDAKSDIYPPVGADARLELKERLLKSFGDAIPAGQQVQQSLQELLSGSLGLGPITDIIGYTLPFSIEQKLRLLSEADVDKRAATLIELLGKEQFTLETFEKSSHHDGEDGSGHDSSGFGSSGQNSTGQKSSGNSFPPPFSLN